MTSLVEYAPPPTAPDPLDLGLRALEAGDLEAAKRQLESPSSGGGRPSASPRTALLAGLLALWDDRLAEATALLELAIETARATGEPNDLVTGLDALVACSERTGHHEAGEIHARRAMRRHRTSPTLIAAPVIAKAFLETRSNSLSLNLPTMVGAPKPHAHHRAFAAYLRAEAAKRADDVVAYRLAQSDGRALLLPSQAGRLLLALLSDRELPRATQSTSPQLTDREVFVLGTLAGPLSLAEIARELHVSRNTVKSQVGSVFQKLGVSNRASAVECGRKRGLIPGR